MAIISIGMNKAIFLDKDGTLIKDVPYNIRPEAIEFYPDTIDVLRSFKNAGFKLIVVSNQAGVALGYFEEEALSELSKAINRLLGKYKIQIDDFYYCPHHPEGKIKKYSKKCQCRKPEPGLFYKACNDHGINVEDSWMIGDILNDMEAGNSAGCRTVMVDVGNETEWVLNEKRRPDYIVKSLKEAKDMILFAESGR
jgi:D-glycero-D-manno-heptose 1,7-bisphosphate phosphatase